MFRGWSEGVAGVAAPAGYASSAASVGGWRLAGRRGGLQGFPRPLILWRAKTRSCVGSGRLELDELVVSPALSTMGGARWWCRSCM
jgi:hypothetical protein